MTTKELRIGNYVFDHKHSLISKVAEIDEIGILANNGYSRLQQEIQNYEPILLTEEWLLKFGFENEDENGFYKNGMYILLYKERCTILYNQLHVNVFYVHQLQNLYFALTGLEL